MITRGRQVSLVGKFYMSADESASILDLSFFYRTDHFSTFWRIAFFSLIRFKIRNGYDKFTKYFGNVCAKRSRLHSRSVANDEDRIKTFKLLL